MSEDEDLLEEMHPCRALFDTDTPEQVQEHIRTCPTCRAIDTTLTVDPDGLGGTLTFLVEKEQS